MRGSAFCYSHARRIAPQRQQSPAEDRIEISSKLDNVGIVQTLHQVLNGLASGRISPRRASILIYGLQMAADHPQQCNPASPGSVPGLPAELQATLDSIFRQTGTRMETR